MQSQDPKLKKILDQLSQFNFDFYGYDDNGMPLVKSPDGQIIEINIAINFVNDQIKKRQVESSSPGSFEAPNLAENLDNSVSVENSAESNLEKKLEESGEQEKSEDQNNQKPIQDNSQNIQKTPNIEIKRPKNKPYGDGFDPVSFDPADINSTLDFINKNKTKSNQSSKKWLSVQFQKFLKEYESGLLN